MTVLRSRITGVGSAVPPRVVDNEELTQFMDTDPEWIVQRTGIRSRRWAEPTTETSVSSLAHEASVQALEDAGLPVDEVDLIVLATLSSDAVFPGSACFLQAKLGIPGVPALDVRQQCSGFIYALSIADHFVRCGTYRNVLVVGAELQSKALDMSTRGRDMTVLFGDGAGCVVLQAAEVADVDPRTSKESFVISTHLHADGRFAEKLILRSPGSGNRLWSPPEHAGAPESYPQMDGRLVFTHAVKHMHAVTLEALEANGLLPDDVDLWVHHQANQRINDKLAEALGVPAAKVFDTIAMYGNTTAATIPLGLHEAVKAGRLEPGMLVASTAFGSGFTWASALYRW